MLKFNPSKSLLSPAYNVPVNALNKYLLAFDNQSPFGGMTFIDFCVRLLQRDQYLDIASESLFLTLFLFAFMKRGTQCPLYVFNRIYRDYN